MYSPSPDTEERPWGNIVNFSGSVFPKVSEFLLDGLNGFNRGSLSNSLIRVAAAQPSGLKKQLLERRLVDGLSEREEALVRSLSELYVHLAGENQAFVSRGGEFGTFCSALDLSVEGSETNVRVYQDGFFNRSPQIRVFRERERVFQFLSFSLKGAGIFEKTKGMKFHENESTGQFKHLPFHHREYDEALSDSPTNDMVRSGIYAWGGEAFRYAREEYLNLQVARAILDYDESGRSLLKYLPVPLGLYKYKQIPVIDRNDRIQLVRSSDYRRLFFADKNDFTNPTVLVLANRCDLRIPWALDYLFNHPSVANYSEIKERIDELMGFIYRLHGLEPKIPKKGPKLYRSCITNDSIVGYLHEFNAENDFKGTELFRQIHRDLSLVVEMFHTCNCHLGGGRLKISGRMYQGAVSGGATAPRNVNLLGGLNDFDTNTLLKVQISGDGLFCEAESTAEIERAKIMDILYLGESLYWLGIIYTGRSSQVGAFSTIEMGGYNDFSFFELDPEAISLRESIKLVELGFAQRNFVTGRAE